MKYLGCSWRELQETPAHVIALVDVLMDAEGHVAERRQRRG